MSDWPLWYKDAIIYEVHVRCFYDSNGDGIGDFKGLTEKLDYLADLGITAIWLLPFYPSPLKDDGYDISDYMDVHPSFGTLRDFRTFLKEAKSRGLKVITELVINHTSIDHPWFQRARTAKKGSSFRDFYVWSDKADKYSEARIIFQDFETSNWAYDSVAESYYWHRFYYHQPDLNFDNPEVEKAIQRILTFWLKMGVDGLRLDAVPYLYEREKSTCENLPETHAFLKRLRKYVDDHFKNRMLLAEANQWPEDAAKYFGSGDECHMAFHFPVMPRLFMSIHLEDSLPIIEIARQTPFIPSNCQWVLFLRNHDELTLEMVTDEERDYMWTVYAHDHEARLNLGIRRRLAPLLQKDRRKIELMNVLLFSLTGTPSIYYGDEIGMGDNIYLGDRGGVRTPMQWSPDRNAGFSRANPQKLYQPPIVDPEYHYETLNVEAEQNNPFSLLRWTKQLISQRKKFKAFGHGSLFFISHENRKVLVFMREFENEKILIVANLSRFAQYVELDLSKYEGFHLIELFSNEHFPKIGQLPYFLTLGPYGYYWFALEKTEKPSLQTPLLRPPEIRVKGSAERIFSHKMRRTLEYHLYHYLFRNPTYKKIGDPLDRINILDTIRLDGIHLVFCQIYYQSGLGEKIPLYLAIKLENLYPFENQILTFIQEGQNTQLCDLAGTKELTDLFLEWIHHKKRKRGEIGEVEGRFLHPMEENLPHFTHHEENIGTKKNGRWIHFPTPKTLLKHFTHLREGRESDVEIKLFLLNNTDFRGFLPIIGMLEYYSLDDKIFTLGEEVAAYHPDYSAKKQALEETSRFLLYVEINNGNLEEKLIVAGKTIMEVAGSEMDPEVHKALGSYQEITKNLGEFTAHYHHSISSSSNPLFSPTRFTLFNQRSLYQNVRKKIVEGKSSLKNKPEAFSFIFEKEDFFFDKLRLLLTQKFDLYRIRFHGDFTLENLIFSGKEFFILNFDTRPIPLFIQGPYKRTPLVDIASILYSFAESALEAVKRDVSRGVLKETNLMKLEERALSWSLWIGSTFLNAYLSKLKSVNSALFVLNSVELDQLIYIFLIEKCFEKMQKEVEISLKILRFITARYETRPK